MAVQRKLVLRMTARQHAELRTHLFPGDGKEAAALALCGTRAGRHRTVLCVHKVHAVPLEHCPERSAGTLRWNVEPHVPLFAEAARRKMVVLKLHSHASGHRHFSKVDDISDRQLLGAVERLAPSDGLHASAVMMPDGSLIGRVRVSTGEFRAVDHINVIGDDIVRFDRKTVRTKSDGAFLRTQQSFGPLTVAILRRLRVGIVGCSGTGSWVVEMLARLGVGELVLVDPDRIERKNLNRIVNSTGADARRRRPKVSSLRGAIRRMGLGTKVCVFRDDILRRPVVEALAECDLMFGCMDSADGRDALNRIAAFYCLPYIDVGVHLDADGRGGVHQVCAAVNYLIPDGSSLLSRRVITSEQVRADSLNRRRPAEYKALRKEGYIQGVRVDSPAVISVNGFAASHALNEMLARLHPFRRDGNAEYRHQTFSLIDGAWLRIEDGSPCAYLAKRAGRGDVIPLLENPELA